jgi:hypothetical protein
MEGILTSIIVILLGIYLRNGSPEAKFNFKNLWKILIGVGVLNILLQLILIGMKGW